MGRTKKVVTGSKIKMQVAQRSAVSITGSDASTRLAVSKMAARVLRSEFGQGLGGLEIHLNNNSRGHANRWKHRIVVGAGEGMERTMHVLLHEMAHIKTSHGCFNDCKRGGACDCRHNVAFHVLLFKMLKKFLTKEAAGRARRREYEYHPKMSQTAAEQMRLGKEHKAWRAERREANKVAKADKVEAQVGEVDARLAAAALEWNRATYRANLMAAQSGFYAARGCKMRVLKAEDFEVKPDGTTGRKWFGGGYSARVHADGRVIGAFGKPVNAEWTQKEEGR